MFAFTAEAALTYQCAPQNVFDCRCECGTEELDGLSCLCWLWHFPRTRPWESWRERVLFPALCTAPLCATSLPGESENETGTNTPLLTTKYVLATASFHKTDLVVSWQGDAERGGGSEEPFLLQRCVLHFPWGAEAPRALGFFHYTRVMLLFWFTQYALAAFAGFCGSSSAARAEAQTLPGLHSKYNMHGEETSINNLFSPLKDAIVLPSLVLFHFVNLWCQMGAVQWVIPNIDIENKHKSYDAHVHGVCVQVGSERSDLFEHPTSWRGWAGRASLMPSQWRFLSWNLHCPFIAFTSVSNYTFLCVTVWLRCFPILRINFMRAKTSSLKFADSPGTRKVINNYLSTECHYSTSLIFSLML